MKKLSEYIVEAIRAEKLNNKLKENFVHISNLYDSMQKSKSTNASDIDTSQMRKYTSPISLKDCKDPNILKVVKNKLFGSQLTFDTISTPEKILNPNGTFELNVDNINVLLYFLPDNNNEYYQYYLGCVMFSDSPQVVSGYANLLFIDVAKIVNNSQELLTAMYNDFITYLKDNTNRNNCLGIAAQPQNNYVKKNMTLIGLKTSNVNKDIFIIKL